MNVFPIWLFVPCALITGFFGAFFTPAISSIVPDIVKDKESLTKANSARGISQTASQLLGTSLGGLAYSLLKGPVFFIINGISFIYSSLTELFIKIPKKTSLVREKTHIIQDMIQGLKFTWNQRGIRILLVTGMFINFFSTMAVTLLTPLFKLTPEFGTERYGFAMGSLMIGTIFGMLILSSVAMPSNSRFAYYKGAVLIMIMCMICAGLTRSFAVIMVLAFVTGILNAVISIITQTVLMITVPEINRGKVFGIMGTVSEGLTPIAMAISGVVAEFLGVRATIVGAFAMAAVAVMPSLFNKVFKAYMNSADVVHVESNLHNKSA